MSKSYLICGLELLLLLASAYGIILPEHNCSKYFTYGLDSAKNYIGIFTAPKAVHHVVWNISFVWQGTEENPITSVEHFPSREEAVHNMNSGRRAQLMAQFKNINQKLPKLVHLEFNNETLCENPEAGNKYSVTRVISASKAITEIDNTRPEMLPIFPTIVPRRNFGMGFTGVY